MDQKKIQPHPLFADAESVAIPIDIYFGAYSVVSQYLAKFSAHLNVLNDFEWARAFLAVHSGTPTTYGNYRAFVERLLLWSWIYCGKSAITLTTKEFGEFILFNENPPETWIGDAARRRFFFKKGEWGVNEAWRPIDSRKTKAKRRVAQELQEKFIPEPRGISASNASQLLKICCSFYRFLILKDIVVGNPAMAARDKLVPARKVSIGTGRELTSEQWGYVIDVAEKMANNDSRYERDLFIIVTIYSMYLRGAELSGNDYWTPTMGAFTILQGTWWFEIVGRNNEISRVSVRPDFMPYLVRYRQSRNLPPLPSHGEMTPLLTTLTGRPGLTDRQIRNIIQRAFDNAHAQMKSEGFDERNRIALLSASATWLRNTSAASDAPKRNPVQLRKDLRQRDLLVTIDRFYSGETENISNRGHGSKIRS